MRVSDFDYHLPPELIAQTPAPRRDESRLLVLERQTGKIQDRTFKDFPEMLSSNDLLVLNDTKVIPARIYGKALTPSPSPTGRGGRGEGFGRKIELLLLRELEPGLWEALSRPSRKARTGVRLSFQQGDSSADSADSGTGRKSAQSAESADRSGRETCEYADIIEWGASGVRKIRFSTTDVLGLLNRKGEVPLPPYIKQKQNDDGRYQTVYARRSGAVAAPTAGLHFTPEMLAGLCAQHIDLAYVTLHAGLGTFRPVKAETVEEHTMYQEELEITAESAQVINEAQAAGKRLVAVGTTVTRALEAQAVPEGKEKGEIPPFALRPSPLLERWQVQPARRLTDLFIYPGYQFKMVNALLTNFHLPRSTLLMLVSAFADREMILKAYEHAIAERYRFYSFGDAMLIL